MISCASENTDSLGLIKPSPYFHWYLSVSLLLFCRYTPLYTLWMAVSYDSLGILSISFLLVFRKMSFRLRVGKVLIKTRVEQ